MPAKREVYAMEQQRRVMTIRFARSIREHQQREKATRDYLERCRQHPSCRASLGVMPARPPEMLR